MTFEDILYEVRNGAAWITINRPDKMNAFRGTADRQSRIRGVRLIHASGLQPTHYCIEN
jgi:hypothetical protein